MKEIKLNSKGKFTGRFVAFVDDEDYDYLNQFKWYATKSLHTHYARKDIKVDGKRSTIPMHRFILNVQKGMAVDHINGNGLDNRRANIRICTYSQNQKNKRPCGFSKYMGVSRFQSVTRYKSKKTGAINEYVSRPRFIVHIKTNGKYKHIGLFDNERDAALAYNEAAKKYHGEFARLNII